MSQLKWYVLRAIAGQEKKIKSYLDNEVARRNLNELVPQVLIPTEKVYDIKNGKKRLREKNFFPGYILINADLNSNAEVLPIITHIPGVLGFLGDDKGGTSKNPVPIRQAEVNRILGIVDQVEETGSTVKYNYIVGEVIKVMDGPFNGFTGTIEKVFEERKKLSVTVKIFGRNTPVELSYTQVEKIE